ncbi:rod shape-determining protein MreD [Hydrogenophaga flava]|uniref:rod shape-determining protein MreD n=1 Tax=Hydrogenophaga flava TaxID=65657 RepID=UPI0008255094|nr:rod shape-determining protein MreD [Hydrogenophaga flava]
MIMRPGQQLLLPANPVFIWSSLFGALLINILMNMGLWGRAAWTPDLLIVALVFWSVHQPLRIGVGTAFFFGLVIDVHQGALLGQHALAYTVLGYFAVFMHRRLLWFDVPTQAVQVLPLFFAVHALEWLVRLIAGDGLPDWSHLLAPVIEAALWPVASVLLLAPQRRAPDPDDNRPL